jgi:hypothetical protein
MTSLAADQDARAATARAGEYARHQPEQTLLYQLVETYYPRFVEHLAVRERALPAHVVRNTNLSPATSSLRAVRSNPVK